MKDFIKTHQPPLSQRWICKQIGYSEQSFSQWMNGTNGRKMPEDKREALRELLEGLGWKG